jgi:hypothetical protein
MRRAILPTSSREEKADHVRMSKHTVSYHVLTNDPGNILVPYRNHTYVLLSSSTVIIASVLIIGKRTDCFMEMSQGGRGQLIQGCTVYPRSN